MEQVILGAGRGPAVSQIACGLWRLHSLDLAAAKEYLSNALNYGITFYDIAAVYGAGEAERQLGRVFAHEKTLRERMILQTKCGNIISKDNMLYYDFSKEEIISSVEASLSRMKTDYLDILLLHRPDTLYEPEEIAEAFAALKSSGKVRYFGVSN